MDREEFLAALRRERVVAIARGGTPGALVDALGVIADEGLCVAEVSLSHPGALDALTEAADRLADRILLGAGTVIEASQVEMSARAGARFIVTPGYVHSVQDAAGRFGLPTLTGALTPTEVLGALAAGASAVKLFPAGAIGGVAYLRDLLAPLPDAPIVPVGGIGPGDAGAYLAAGALAVGVGSPLFGDVLAGIDRRELAVRARTLRNETAVTS